MEATENKYMQLETEIVNVLRTIFDPEIPVNIFELGLIYEIKVEENNNVSIRMTLTAPNCPMADELLEEVTEKVKAIPGVNEFNLVLTFDPPWTQEMLSEEAMLELGLM
jgi:FeS assembly SUF system protein